MSPPAATLWRAAALILCLSTANAEPQPKHPCSPDAPIESLLARYDLETPSNAKPRELLISYYRCLALAWPNTVPCLHLKNWNATATRQPGLYDDCLHTYYDDRMTYALLLNKIPEAAVFCKKIQHVSIKPRDNDKACDLFTSQYWQDTTKAVESLYPLFKTTPDEQGRIAWQNKFRMRMGEESYCARAKYQDEADSCREVASFRRARAANDPRLCEGSGICRMLMGLGPGSCEIYVSEARTALCNPH